VQLLKTFDAFYCSIEDNIVFFLETLALLKGVRWNLQPSEKFVTRFESIGNAFRNSSEGICTVWNIINISQRLANTL
jgi:hypothetical protein